MKIKRAIFSLAVSALVPGTVSLLWPLANHREQDLILSLILFFVWYICSFPVVLIVGLSTFLVALKAGRSFLAVAPIVGALAGAAAGWLMLGVRSEHVDYWLLAAAGGTTACVAVLIYAKPWQKGTN